ncbi:uncharacterized protein LOC124633414 [Helicoverpa zea]|uniref:uncharacterized protein LOC124633414 n=1 Tax=Helicoverpa zea TaxID=7113 RepID=UPI001F57844A|nr:uncharacterized protein LOC124633414 [Helicoverpa zea]
MSQVSITLPLLWIFLIRLVYGYPDDSVMLMPQFEMRSMDPQLAYSSPPYTRFQETRPIPRQVLHTSDLNKKQVPLMENRSKQNMSLGEFVDAINRVSQESRRREEEFQRPRTIAAAGREDNSGYPTLPRPTGYPKPNYAPPATYHEPSNLAPVAPPAIVEPKSSLDKLDFSSLLTPISTKVASKSSGLLSLILSLFSGSSSGLSGLKSGIIEGIIKPLLVAKGGIKALISKLSIPLLSLLLINLEVLITVWWLWEEECPKFPEPVPSYSKPTTSSSPPPYNYNNSYR